MILIRIIDGGLRKPSESEAAGTGDSHSTNLRIAM